MESGAIGAGITGTAASIYSRSLGMSEYIKEAEKRPLLENNEDVVDIYRSLEKASRSLTEGDEGGIIKETEYGVPYGEYSLEANMTNINSDMYAKKYNITDNDAVNESLLKCVREAIDHRKGTKFEDMYIINANTGEVMGSQTEMKYESGIEYNDSIISAISISKEKNIPIIAIHNHPEGLPPSIEDFNKAYDNNYLFGVVCGHNEQVYVYYKPIARIRNVDEKHNQIVMAYKMGMDIDRAFGIMYDELGIEYKIMKGEEK